jgi:gliding motility-associated-like protein
MLKVGLNRHFHRSWYASYRILVVLIVALFPAIASWAQPAINSVPGPAATNGTFGSPYIYEITTDTWPNSVALTLVAGAPGLALVDHSNGTATLSGSLASAGSFPISIQVTDLTDNQASTQNFTLDVAKAVLTPTANNQSRIYGTTIPVFTISYSGFKFDDDAGDINTPPTASVLPVTASTAPGNYPINVSIATASDNNYSFATPVNGTLTISPAPLTVTAVNKSKTYGAANPGFTVTYTGFQNGESEGNLASPATAGVTGIDQTTGAGIYTINVNGGSSPNYTIARVTGTLTINKALLTVTANDKTRIYGQDNPTFTFDYGGFLNGDNTSAMSTLPGITTTIDATTDAGTYTITPGGAVSNNYNFNYVAGNLVINKAPLTVTADPKTKVYGDALPSLTFQYSGFLFGQNSSVIDTAPTIGTTATAASPVGTYTITASGGAAKNYSFSTFIPANLTVTKAVLTAKADNQTRVYGLDNAPLTITYTGFVNGDTEVVLNVPGPKPTASVGADKTSPVNTYTITVSGGTDDNYSFSYATGTLTVTKATVTATADPKSRVYGIDNPPLTFTYSGFANNETAGVIDTPPSISTTAAITSHVGTYPIDLSGGTDNNYNITLVSNNLTVTKAPLTITADNKSKVYGAILPDLTASYTGFKNDDTPSVFTTPLTLTTTAASTSPVGSSYTITPSAAVAGDYNITFVVGTLTVTKAVLTATAQNATRTYGSPNPGFTIVYTGFVNGESVAQITQGSASTTANATANVGTYAITPANASATNYSFNYVDGTLTITQATLNATAASASRAYGSVEPVFNVNYSGFLNGQNESVLTQKPIGTPNATVNSDVGTYTITLSGGTATNYTFNYFPGVLTITKATVTAVADNKAKTYGDLNPTLTVSYIGLKNGQDGSVIATPPNLSTTAGQFSNAGNYTIGISGGSDENYAFTYTNGTLAINKAVLTATADDKSRSYGSPNPVFTFHYTGFLGTDVPANVQTQPTISVTAPGSSSVGTYPITLSGAADENYTFVYVPGTLTINKAILTTKPDNKTRTYGAPNPTLTISYNGFVNGENATVIDVKAMASTTATNTSDVGVYDITATGASDNNYDFVYNPGTITITKASLTLIANNQTKVYGAANPTLTITYSGFQNGDTQAVLDAPAPAISTTATVASPVGNSYPITITNSVDNNYTYNIVSGTLTITKANLTITAGNKTRAYNSANPTFTLTYAGFLNGDTESSITPPTPSTSATLTSAVGNYSINLGGGSAANYNIILVAGTLTITKGTPITTWNTPAAIVYGTPLGATQLNASANVPGSFDYTPAGGTILNAGVGRVLTAVFTPSDVTNYNIVSNVTTTITVNKATPVVTWANPAQITYGTLLNLTNQLNATANVQGGFVYTPGEGTLLNAGANQQLKADFHPQDAANYNDVLNITRQITVVKATPVVTWSNPASIPYGTPLGATQLNATFSVLGNPTYIPSAGTILPTGNNQIFVSFTPNDQANYNSISNFPVSITVVKASPVVTWSSPADIVYGTPLNTTDHLNPTHSVAGSFSFNPPAGTVLNAGNGQTLTATFTPSDLTNYNVISNITTTINVNRANPAITWTAPSPIVYGTALGASQLNASTPVAGGFAYNPQSGTVLNAGANQAISATFTPTDLVNYNTVVANRTITVNKATPLVTWPSPAQITYGTPLGSTQQNASANVPGTYTYTPPDGTILNTGANQNISVKFEPNDATNYNIVPTTTTQITVIKATPVVTWATPLPIKVGVALSATQLNATSNIPGTPTYTPGPGTVFNVEGTYTLHVSYHPNDPANYNDVPDTQVQIVVSSKDNPVITWSDPAAITYGDPLTVAQLNATGSVPGNTTYNPALGTKLDAGANQNLEVTFTPTDLVNYNIVKKTVHINVNKATLTATADNANRPYGSNNPIFGQHYSGFVAGDNSSMIDTPPSLTCAAIAASPAGNTFPIVPSGGSDNNYQFTYVNGTLTIDKATLTATANNQSRAYGLSNPTLTISYSGFANNDNETVITQPGISTTASIASNVGNYPITLSGGSASNYNIALQPGTLTITKALLIVIGSDLTRTYGEANPSLTFPLAFKYGGFRNGDDETVITTPPTAATSATAASGVGVYAINISGGLAQNYSFVPLAGSLTINKAALTIKADNKTRSYGQANPPNTMSFIGFVNGDDKNDITLPTFTGPNASVTDDAKTYAIQLSGGSATNYDITLQNGELTVTKATLTAKANNKSKVYGDTNPLFDISYVGFLNGDDASKITPPTAATTATVTSSVDTYPITLSGGTATNYDFTLQSGTLTVTPAPLTARAADRTRPYGQANPTLGIIYSGFLNGDTRSTITQPTASTTATITSNFGTYPITLTGGSALNYTLTLQPGTLTVSKASLTATVDDKTKVYGSTNPTNSITYSGFVNGDDVSAITPPVISGPFTNAFSAVGSYPITLSGGTATNYNIALVNGSLSITKAPLTAKADNQSRVYGAADPLFTITYTGFVNGETSANITKPVLVTTATATSNVGTYPIQLSGTTANYDFTFVDGTLTIGKANVTVTAENKTRAYGSANPPLTVTYSGLANNETTSVIDTPPNVTTAAIATTPASSNVPIQVSGAVDNNYSFTYVAGSLTVTKAPLTATADNKSRPYGSPNPATTITYTGFQNGEGVAAITPPNITTAAVATSVVGAYPIVLTNGSAINYQITLQNGTLTVTPAILTVKAADKSRTYGTNNPLLTVTYTGFVNGQSIADIDVLPVATTTATITTPAGPYAIKASGGADTNYGFTYTDGLLTINKATLTATADSKTTTYGTIPNLSISYSGFVNGEAAGVIETPPIVSTMALPTSTIGTYPIALNGGSDENYNIVDVAGTLTINKAPLTVKADDKTRITGVANPEFTMVYSGFVNGEGIDEIDTRPVATTAAIVSSPAGTYAIEVSGGNDNHYNFVYQPGTLTIVLDNPPVVKNFQVETDEDTRFTFTLDNFQSNYTDETIGKIKYIKISSLPLNGTLFRGAAKIVANDEIAVTGGQMEELYYIPNSNYAGNDPFSWNLFDGSYLSVNNATVTIKVRPVNDPPVLSNIEPNAILYSPGDKPVPVTGQMIINDVDDNFIFSASVRIAENRTEGDKLAIPGGLTAITTEIEVSYDAQQGELTLTGKETRAIYETILKKVTFSTPVNAQVTQKSITMMVRDSIASSNIASRSIEITELLPELDIVNAFTPNGDGVNDDWDIRNLDSYSDVMITVFNREGAKVFSCTSNDCKWDGRLKGELQPAGPYSYVIDLNNGKRRYKGTVNVLR